MSYVYVQSEKQDYENDIHGLWTVGFYDPSGEWQPESDHPSPEEAAERVAYLNGATDILEFFRREVRALNDQLVENVKIIEEGNNQTQEVSTLLKNLEAMLLEAKEVNDEPQP